MEKPHANPDDATSFAAKGLFIAFEGIDGAGKTTQVGRLQSFLARHGEEAVRSKEPTDGPWGQKIRVSATTVRMSLADELNAFLEDRREHVGTLIQPALNAGRVVLLDRYFYSTIAYQGARGVDTHELHAAMLSQFPVPDVVFLIDVPASVGLSRVSQGRGETPNQFETMENLRHVRQAFRDMYEERNSEGMAKYENIVLIDGNSSIEFVQWKVLDTLVRGPFKDRYCAKVYGCDDPVFCAPRLAGDCKWFELCREVAVLQPND